MDSSIVAARITSLLQPILALALLTPALVSQNPAPVPAPAAAYRIAGTVVSQADGRPLGRARVSIGDTRNRQKPQSFLTSDDGKFQFTLLPAGKYSLSGAKRGFISASYDQHDQVSTAIVTGAGLSTEDLVLRLPPAAIVTGRVLDESGDPVRHANLALYRTNHDDGVTRIQPFRHETTDDLGSYEFDALNPGTYFLSVTATPWYAIHPRSSSASPNSVVEPSAHIDPALDVAYPPTYYVDTPDAQAATPIPLHAGDHPQLDFHLSPVPALHLLFHAANGAESHNAVPRLEQFGLDGEANFAVVSGDTHMLPDGTWEIEGVPAGRYGMFVDNPNGGSQVKEFSVATDGQEINASDAEPLSTVKVLVRVVDEKTIPSFLVVGLVPANGTLRSAEKADPKGEVELKKVIPGTYQVMVWGSPTAYAITGISSDSGQISGHRLTVPAGATMTVSLFVADSAGSIEGVVKRNDKPVAGAMVVLVPKDPASNPDLFRRDQSDQDGTFTLQFVVPGSYTVLAIQDGWDIDWAQPAVIAPYLKGGQAIEIGKQRGRPATLPNPVEAQSK